jgi:hypothetical protein
VAQGGVSVKLFNAKIKRLEKEISFLHGKLEKFDIKIEQTKEEFSKWLQEEQKNNQTTVDNTALSDKAPIELGEEDLKEIEVLKYKYEHGLELVRKDYEEQLEYASNKVSFHYTFIIQKAFYSSKY